MHAYNLSTDEAETGGSWVEANVIYIMKYCLKNEQMSRYK